MRYPIIVYNNFKNSDWLAYKGGMPKGTIILMNNENIRESVQTHLNNLGYKVFWSIKLCENDAPVFGYTALDAENYRNDIIYSSQLGLNMTGLAKILYPENLGGDKYKNYDVFIAAANPDIVILERRYSCWYIWDLVRFWNRNKYLRDTGIKVYIGIWLESIPKPFRWLQWNFAKLLSGGCVMFYSETKCLPPK